MCQKCGNLFREEFEERGKETMMNIREEFDEKGAGVRAQLEKEFRYTEPVFVNVYGGQESIPRNRLRHAM